MIRCLRQACGGLVGQILSRSDLRVPAEAATTPAPRPMADTGTTKPCACRAARAGVHPCGFRGLGGRSCRCRYRRSRWGQWCSRTVQTGVRRRRSYRAPGGQLGLERGTTTSILAPGRNVDDLVKTFARALAADAVRSGSRHRRSPHRSAHRAIVLLNLERGVGAQHVMVSRDQTASAPWRARAVCSRGSFGPGICLAAISTASLTRLETRDLAAFSNTVGGVRRVPS